MKAGTFNVFNKNQRISIIVGLAVILFMLIVPPWTYNITSKGFRTHKLSGYHSIFTPPEQTRPGGHWYYEIDYGRLGIQVLAAVCGMSVALIGFSMAENKERKSGSIKAD